MIRLAVGRWIILAVVVLAIGVWSWDASTHLVNPTGPPATPVGDYPPVPSDLTYAFGAKFEPPDGRIVHGMGQWESYNPKYLSVLGDQKYYPASQALFFAIGDTPRGWSPEDIERALQEKDDAGLISQIDIALRGLKPLPSAFASLPDPYYGIDDVIAAGPSKYDARIQDVVDIVKDFKKPIMIRIGGEFSGNWNGYQPYAYPKAFRKIVQMFRDAGVENAAFIWCYEPAAADDFDEMNALGEYKWFPGNDVVDWYGIDVFANKDIQGAEVSNGKLTQYGKTVRFLDFALANGKPVIIAESSPSDVDITPSLTDGEADWKTWFVPYFSLLNTHPTIKWFHYINYDWSLAGDSAAQGWKDADISDNAYIAGMFAAEMKKPQYLHTQERYLLKDYVQYL
ncbi:MAG: hypothetical protein HY369_01550 [Candidatus Aenigmarchaeota archaeon]|nr:hypothetical protein [Candidatus Aenigmarchaeota archaeon]